MESGRRPRGPDLRLITTSLKITTDLDRIGRYAKDVAELILQVQGAQPEGLRDQVRIPRMADLTIQMVDLTIESFVRRDAESARNIMEADDAVDVLHDEVLADLISSMRRGELDIEAGARYILVNRYLERIADHAVNIETRVVYMVTGDWMPRVRAADRARRRTARAG